MDKMHFISIVETLFNEWLMTLDDEETYYTDIQTYGKCSNFSDRIVAKAFTVDNNGDSFLSWLRKREVKYE